MTINELRYSIRRTKKRMKGCRSDARSCDRIISSIPKILDEIITQMKYIENKLKSEEFDNINLFQYGGSKSMLIRDFDYLKSPYEIKFLKDKLHVRWVLERFLGDSKEDIEYFKEEEERWQKFREMFDEEANFYEIKQKEFELKLLEKIYGEDVKKLIFYKEMKEDLNFDKMLFRKFSFVLTNESNRNSFKSFKEEINALINITAKEKNRFISACVAVLKFKEHVLNRGIYSAINNISEKEFKEEIFRFIDLNYNIKDREIEPESAGGKVDLVLFGIPMEFKVIRTERDLNLLEEMNSGQIVSYCTGRSSRFGINCFLDLIEKKDAPSFFKERDKLFKAPLHGVKENEQKYPIYIEQIIIDGNTKKPSDYSK